MVEKTVREILLEKKQTTLEPLFVEAILEVEKTYQDLLEQNINEAKDYIYNQAIKQITDNKTKICTAIPNKGHPLYIKSIRQRDFLEQFYHPEELSAEELDKYCIDVFNVTSSYEEFLQQCKGFAWRNRVSTKRVSEWYSLATGALK